MARKKGGFAFDLGDLLPMLRGMSVFEPWATRAVAEGRWVRQDFGPLSLLVMNFRGEWRIAKFPSGAPEGLRWEGRADEVDQQFDWERWDREGKDSRLHFRPAYPNLPVVARPKSALYLSPKGNATFFVGIPAWIDVFGECQGTMLRLKTIPTEVMSKTWHGSPLAGSLAYALGTYARRVFERETWPAHEIVSSIGIVNEGKEHLPFQRLYLETQHLSVFEKDSRLWGNAARIRVDVQETNVSNVTYAPRPGTPFDDAVEITPPREGRRRKSTIQSAFSKVMGHFNPLDDPS